MRKIFLLVLFATSLVAAEKITVELNTDKATLEEHVTAVVRIESETDMEPKLSADGSNADIVASEYQGEATSTVYMNGELTTKREFIFNVVLKPKNYGRSGLINISADVGGRILRHNSVWFTAVAEKSDLAPVFLLAVPSKTQVYENEAILVRYYLMSQVDIAAFDIKEFPKLNNFVKRYLQEQGVRERVAYEGKQFVRQLLYSLVLFPEKAKALKLDPMRVNVSYDQDGNRDPFGFGRGRIITKTISSKSIDIEVLNIPSDKLPTGYTGLVGKHKFTMTMSKSKVLVNEPIEIKLKISGTGNLEGADAPSIIQDSSIESFDANSNFEIVDAVNANKTFEYTFLPRKETSIPAQKIPLSYFNPETRSFETAEVDFPGLEVVGGAYQPASSKIQNQDVINPTSPSSHKPQIIINEPKYSGPILEQNKGSWSWSALLNCSFLFLIIGILLKMLFDIRENFPWVKPSIYKTKLRQLAENGLTYSSFEDLLLEFPKIESNISLKEKIDQLSMPAKSKEGLGKLVDTLNQKYTVGKNHDISEKTLWNNYKNDLCMLIQALESWDSQKLREQNENL